MTPTKKLFLLGGYDLEMLSIKRMIEGRDGCVVADKCLNWGNALLSAYEDIMPEYCDADIYGIELREDIPVPANYHRIDHHNALSDMPSSLEQVAEVLGVTLNRHQQLVAANDRGYIPAMERLEATEDEIRDIRRGDRAAQGVTNADEQMAELSIKENCRRYGDLTVVKSATSLFSAICDRLYPFSRLLIYTDYEWMFYGEGKAELASFYDEEIRKGKIFHGGGRNGYIGAERAAYDSARIKEFVIEIEKRYGNK